MFCVTNEIMRNSDQETIKKGRSSLELISRVGQELWLKLCNLEGKIYIICGKGNNGADGICLANIMLENNIFPYIFFTEENLNEDSIYFLKQLQDKGYDKIFDISQCDYKCDVLIDCIFGTGFSGKANEKYLKIFQQINSIETKVISIDIPSGLNGDNGLGECVIADMTIAIQFFKLGHFLNDGKDVCGEMSVCDVGIELVGDCIKIVDECDARKCFPPRKNNTHKGNYGKSIIIGGSNNFCGAVKLANLGVTALRVGSGYNCVAVPKNLQKELFSKIEESISFGLSEKDGNIIFCEEEIEKLLLGAKSVAIGMGIGDKTEENLKIIKMLLGKKNLDVLIDADGLIALGQEIDCLRGHKANVILTPHPKEMAQLFGCSTEDILSNPLFYAKNLANKVDIVVLLKGSSTLIVDKNNVSIVVNGSPSMAKSGNGDVLSGAITGLLAQGNDVFASAEIGAYLCAKGAEYAKEIYSEYGVLPSDIAKQIAALIKNY